MALLAPLLRILLPIGWLVLISRLIHDESLVGDRQFWITRPYTWPTLLAAKLLFLILFLYLPFFLMQVYLLHHAGLAIAPALPDLLRYHLRLTAIFVLPFVAIATVTSTFARLAISLLVALLYLSGVLASAAYLFEKRMTPPYVEPFAPSSSPPRSPQSLFSSTRPAGPARPGSRSLRFLSCSCSLSSWLLQKR